MEAVNHSIAHPSLPSTAADQSLLKNLIRRARKLYWRKVGHQMLLYLFYFTFFAKSIRSTYVIGTHMTQTAKLLINRRNTCELSTEDYLGHYIFPWK